MENQSGSNDSGSSVPGKTISESELLQYVLDSLQRNAIQDTYPVLEASFPKFEPKYLFRTLVLQQAWVHVCSGQLNDAARLIDELGESSAKHFHEMWRQTTRNKVRAQLYDYLHKQSLLSPKDEENHQILLKITTKYPNTSFTSAQRLNNSPAMKVFADTAKLPSWQPIVDLTADYNENKSMIFPQLFQVPEEPSVDSPKYFIGNIALIEAQTPQTLKLLSGKGSMVEKLWIMHCEHRVTEMAQLFTASKNDPKKKQKFVKFVNIYFNQMNAYEQETLLDILCQSGYFCNQEKENFELLLIRICKNKELFDQGWWSHTTLDFADFFKKFAVYCAEKNLFMPFEMFVISHPKSKEIDISDVDQPLIRFIWDLWVKRDPSSATLSCMQFIAKSNSKDPVELWQSLPSDSLAPLASFVWNKDPSKFQPGSVETEALSNRLKNDYPLLASLVKGEIPHPPSPAVQKPDSKWRSPIFTSKYDLELHDLIASHFEYDFSKVFTNYYGKTPGQPDFPHFDHPELITAPSEPPYVHYVKSMLPVSAFQQAVDDGVDEPRFKNLCIQCMKEALEDKAIRLAALTFIELTDLKFETDSAVDFKIAIAIFDKLFVDGNNDGLIDELSRIFVQKDQAAAQSIQQKLSPNEIELFLLSALLGVRCGLPLDYSAIHQFARNAAPAELLLYIDRAAEIGAHYPIDEVVKIIREEMPDKPLKEHLLFHLTQSLPPDDGAQTGDIQPALVVFRAIRRKEQPPYVSLLQEALNRRQQLYALLATSIEGTDIMTCALVTLLTLTDSFSFDVAHPPEKSQMATLFLQVIQKLLMEKKATELIQALELFSETSIATHIANWFQAVEIFAFRRAEIAFNKIVESIKDRDSFDDDLLGNLKTEDVYQTLYPLEDSLARFCAQKSQVHLFRYLQLLQNSKPSQLLEPRVKLSKVIEGYENFRRAIMQCDLLGDYDRIVSDLVLHHSLALGQATASCLGSSATTATQQWLKFQYSNAQTPAQVLEVHARISNSIADADPMFFVALFAALLPYAQPSMVIEILKFARKHFSDESILLVKQIDALLLHIEICSEKKIEVAQGSEFSPSMMDILTVLFPGANLDSAPHSVPLNITSPVIFGLQSLQRFFETSIDTSIDACLDKRHVDQARLLSEWRHRDPQSILLLEAVQTAISGSEVPYAQQSLLTPYGSTSDMEMLLKNVAKDNGWRFVLISLHYKAANILHWQSHDLLSKTTSEFVKSELPLSFNNWPLVKELISVGKLTVNEAAECLVESFTNHVIKGDAQQDGMISIEDYSEKFKEYTSLCENPTVVGAHLFTKAKELKNDQPLPVLVNLLLHSSICTSDIDECAEMLDTLLDSLTNDKQLDLIIQIVSVFPDPALLPRFFQYLIAQQKLDALPHSKLNEKVGRVIMNCARHVHPFEPQRYFDLTLNYSLYRDHAELQMECGSRLLAGAPDQASLKDASKHFLLALAYFLHEKCYSLSMECLKKLSLISLQLELNDTSVLHLEQDKVIELMCQKDFPFALTIAVAYDMDTEANWAEAIYAQSIAKNGEDFLTSFQYFRPITSNLCNGVVKKYKSGPQDELQRDRMKQFLLNIPNLVERYRISKELEFHDQIDSMKEVNPVVCEWCEKVLMNNQ